MHRIIWSSFSYIKTSLNPTKFLIECFFIILIHIFFFVYRCCLKNILHRFFFHNELFPFICIKVRTSRMESILAQFCLTFFELCHTFPSKNQRFPVQICKNVPIRWRNVKDFRFKLIKSDAVRWQNVKHFTFTISKNGANLNKILKEKRCKIELNVTLWFRTSKEPTTDCFPITIKVSVFRMIFFFKSWSSTRTTNKKEFYPLVFTFVSPLCHAFSPCFL